MDRRLCRVLPTRLAQPRLICPDDFLVSGPYLFVNPRLCLRPPSGGHHCPTLAFGYPSPPSSWVWTFCGIYDIITATWYHTAPFSSRAKPGTQQTDREGCVTLRFFQRLCKASSISLFQNSVAGHTPLIRGISNKKRIYPCQ
jgi:hypothetical protein